MSPLCCSWHVMSRILPRVACANTRVPVSDELGMIGDILFSDADALTALRQQYMTQVQRQGEPCIYRLLAPYQHQQLIQNSSEKRAFTPLRCFFDWPNWGSSCKNVFRCVLTCWMVINFPPSAVMQTPAESGMLTSTSKPSHYLALFHLFVFSLQFFFQPLSSKVKFSFLNKHTL